MMKRLNALILVALVALAAYDHIPSVQAQVNQIFFPRGSEQRPGLALEGEPRTGFYVDDNSNIAASVRGEKVFTLTEDGIQAPIMGLTQNGEPAAGLGTAVPKYAWSASPEPMSNAVTTETESIFALDVTNPDHIGNSSQDNLYGFDAGDMVGDPQATESAFRYGSGWDAGLFASETNSSFLMIPAGGITRIRNFSNNNVVRFGADSASGLDTRIEISQSIGRTQVKRGASIRFAPVTADGNDWAAGFAWWPHTDPNHTGSNNDTILAYGETITSPDTNARHSGLVLEPGWDAVFMADVDGDGWSATDNPPTNKIALFLDESADRGAGTATADCAVVVRLADGTEVAMTPILVVDGGCP